MDDTIVLKNMSAEEFASFERTNREVIVLSGGIHWRMVGPLFWRPLLPFRQYPADLSVPGHFRVGGFQYPVLDPGFSTSTINYYAFEDTGGYDRNQLSARLRSYLNHAMRYLDIREITDSQTFAAQSHPVYLSFLDRTNYGYRRDRASMPVYARWCGSVFASGKMLVLGAYAGDTLAGACVVACVEGVACILSIFTHSEFHHYRVSDFLYHWIRVLARDSKIARSIYAGKFADNPGVNTFKERRGAVLVKAPSYHYINPLLHVPLRYVAPGKIDKILGTVRSA